MSTFSPDLLSTPADKIFYALTMFPYPSGVGLHAGHASVFTINDVIARYKTMSGYTVLNPFGFDAFGLPTENYALQENKGAREVTDTNKAMFLDQVKALNISFDYERIVDTSMPDYYKWTQWIFTKLMEAGLVYRDEKFVNRCPDCQTVLANDQVVDGKCERCKSETFQKKHMQWFIRITDYADRLISDLDLIDRPEETKTTQKNWIGRSEGAEIDFKISNSDTTLTVFTTRPDTLYGVTAVVLAPENTLIDELLSEDKKSEVQSYRNTALAKTAVQRQQDVVDKTGVFSGLYAIHPLTGEQVSVWFADYVLMDYGSGAVMMVPAHDERDREFARKFGIEVKQVIGPIVGEQHTDSHKKDSVYGLIYNSDKSKILIINREDNKRGDITMSLPGGGIDEGENLEKALRREIQEETGLEDFSILGQPLFLQDNYFIPNKGDKTSFRRCNNFHVFVGIAEDETLGSTSLTNEEIGKVLPATRLSIQEREEYLSHMADTFGQKIAYNMIKNPSAYTGPGVLINSAQFDGMHSTEAKSAIISHLESLGCGKKKITYRLRDRSVSRQRYRGSPLPVYYTFEDNEPVYSLEYTTGNKTFQPGKPVTTRNVIQCILKDKATNKYVFLKWKHDNDVTAFFGGIEDNETPEQAVIRELREEGGFTEITSITHVTDYHLKFYHPTKHRNQYSICTTLYAEVDTTKQIDRSEEEKDLAEIVTMTSEEFFKSSKNDTTIFAMNILLNQEQTISSTFTDRYNAYNPHPDRSKRISQPIPESELPVILPLDVTDFKPKGKSPLEDHPTFKYYTPQNYKVPYFEYTDDTWKVQPDKETKLRPTVNAIIQDINTKKYLVLERKIDGTNSFVGGGIEPGETSTQAMLKEINEEAGFKDIISITTIGGKYHRYFFHALKGLNHYTTTQCFFIQVDSTKQLPIDNKELTKHSIQRMTIEEVLNNSKLDYDNTYYLNLHLGNKVEAPAYTDYYNKYNPQPTYLRECDTLDTFMCSSFYFLRFPDAHNDEALIRKELADKCLPVDFYSGGKEHSVGHLLYSRFIHKFLYDQGYVSSPEPFMKLVHQGMVLGADGRKMGKRYNNGVDPLEIVEKYGSDAVRTYLMFMGPIEADKVRNDNALNGIKKFLDRVEKLPTMEWYNTQNDDVIATIHDTIIKITEDIESYKFNTAISKLMIAINTIYDHKAIDAEHLAIIAQLLAPFAPILAEQLWTQTGHDDDIAFSSWPIADTSKITMKPINFPIQINGKMRGSLSVPAGISEQELLALVHADESISKYLMGTNKKIIFVADKIMNIINN